MKRVRRMDEAVRAAERTAPTASCVRMRTMGSPACVSIANRMANSSGPTSSPPSSGGGASGMDVCGLRSAPGKDGGMASRSISGLRAEPSSAPPYTALPFAVRPP